MAYIALSSIHCRHASLNRLLKSLQFYINWYIMEFPCVSHVLHAPEIHYRCTPHDTYTFKNYFHSLLFTTRQSNLYFSNTRGKAAHKTHTAITIIFLMPWPTRKCVLIFYFHRFQFILHLNIYIKHEKIWHAHVAIFTGQPMLKKFANHWKCIKYPMAASAHENLTRSTTN